MRTLVFSYLPVASVSPGCRPIVLTPRPCRFAHPYQRRTRREVLVQAEEASEGPQVDQLEETASLDALIDRLLEAKNQDELTKIVGENILSFDQKLWIRLAVRSESTQDREESKRLADLSRACMLVVEAVIEASESQMQGGAKVLQEILVAACDNKGEWRLPLMDEDVQRMKEAMDKRSRQLGEPLLAAAFASMRKATDDGMEGLVVLVQQVLQLYAARELTKGRAKKGSDEAFLNKALQARENQWADMVKEGAEKGEVSEVGLMEALQKKMEGTVLNLPSGSYAQRVQAEYLKEFEGRAKEAFQQLVN